MAAKAEETRLLRIKARKLGAGSVSGWTRDELEDYIAENSNGHSKKKKAVKVVKAVKAKRGPGRPRKVVVDDDEEEEMTPKRRGRPKGSKNKTANKASTKAVVKRGPGRPSKASKSPGGSRSTSKASTGRIGRPVGSGGGSRVLVSDRINFNRDFDFREGSRFQFLLNEVRKSAKKYKNTADIREDVFERLLPKLNKVEEVTFISRETGKKHTKDRAEAMLRYYISRTVLDYAINTDQHDASYDVRKGSAEAPAKKRGRPRKTEVEDAPRKRGRPSKKAKAEDKPKRRGRPPGSGKKATTTTGKKRGRPKGSKNKR